MQVHIAAVGRLKSGPEKEMCATYLDRAAKMGKPRGFSGLKVIERPESRADSASLRKSEETTALIAGSPPQSAFIVLDETGKHLTSRQFAHMLETHLDSGTRNLTFLIGGPDGHDAGGLPPASQKIALGQMTWPHRLVRIMLAEQIYRAITILTNHPYHRD